MELNIKINAEVISKLESYLESLKNRWDESHPKNSSWLSLSKTYILECTIFLVSVLDDLIVFVQDHIEKGSDKKIVVLAMSAEVFDYIVISAFPVWLRPFASAIKDIVVGVVISQLIEFVVKKYKEGSWKVEGNINPPDSTQAALVYKSRRSSKWKK